MRKILFGIIIVVLLVFTGVTVYKGNDFANLNVWGVTQISDKNIEIDKQNAELRKIVSEDYPNAIKKLQNSSENLQEKKKEYEEKALILSQSKYYKQKEKYKHEFLLTKIGDYARENNVDVKIVISQSGSTEYYNIAFTVTGKYSDVAGYIYDIENDSKLGFKIEDFSMVSAATTINNEDGTTTTTNGVQGKFNCKEIAIELKSLNQVQTTATYDSDSGRQNTLQPTGTTSTQTPETTPTPTPTQAGDDANSIPTPTPTQDPTEGLVPTSSANV